MLFNYLKTTFRNFRRNKGSFLINLIGLSIGMACSILIMMWVIDELNYDRFHKDIDRIYRVMENQEYAKGNIFTVNATPGILAPALKEEIPEIQYATTYTWNINSLFTHEEKSFNESGIYARPDIFSILTIELENGEIQNQLKQPRTIVISNNLAKKYFDYENPVGKTIIVDQEELYTITGVFEDMPDNSSITFDFLLPFDDFLENNQWATNWGSNGPRTLVKLSEGARADQVEEKIEGFIKEKNEGSVVSLFLYPYADLYLYGQFDNGQPAGGRIEYVRLFSIVAVFVLLIACINFMNLSTARASLRAKEVGIRKSIGASRNSLIIRYLGESIIVSAVSLIISILLVILALPVFNELTGKEISLGFISPDIILIILGITLFTGLIAGSYPAFYLSSFEAVNVLKDTIRTSFGELIARRGLVIFQFALSIILIVSTIVVYNQIQYVKNKNIGYKKENVIYFSLEEGVRDQWDSFRQELAQKPGILSVSRANHPIVGRNSSTGGVSWPDKDPDTNVLFETVRVDYDFVETMGFEMVSGRSFSREYGKDSARVLFNEAAIEIMGMENPVGRTVNFWGGEWEIAGVLKNFHYESLRSEVEPLFMILYPGYTNRAFVRVDGNSVSESIKSIESVFKKFNPSYPFDYSFLDERYEMMYQSEQRVGDLAFYFSIFAILISCLGLLGLSAFTTERRTKEIGVRKVLGASMTHLVMLLSKDFTKLVSISILIALPASWWLMKQWLNDYSYHVDLAWWIFAFSALLAILVAWLTVAWQSMKAASLNPVDSLRRE